MSESIRPLERTMSLNDWSHVRYMLHECLRSVMAGTSEDEIARQAQSAFEVADRKAFSQGYFSEIERLRGITGDSGKTRFRPHRGCLMDAMKEVVEVEGRAGLIEHLRSKHPNFGPKFESESLSIEPYGGDDDRIGWKNVHIVVLSDWGPVGFCEGKPT